jgi:hypothetical protein
MKTANAVFMPKWLRHFHECICVCLEENHVVFFNRPIKGFGYSHMHPYGPAAAMELHRAGCDHFTKAHFVQRPY